jgi:predicted dehydrogenase
MKVKLIGTGFGERVVAPVFRSHGAEVEIFHPRDGEGIQRACASDADIISVHSPPYLHKQHVDWALDHKKAVLCDKPFGLSAGESRAMRDRARSLGVPGFINVEFRFQPSRVKMRELLKAGAIGTPNHLSYMFLGPGLRDRRHGWLFDDALGGGWVRTYGSHMVDMLRWLFDAEIVDSSAIRRIEVPVRIDRDGKEQRSTAEDAFSCWIRLDNGVTASVDTSFSTSVRVPQRIVILGSEGALELVSELNIVLRKPGQEDQRFDFPVPTGDFHEPGLTPYLAELMAAVRDGRQIAPSFDDGVAMAEAMDRLRDSPLF